ncbi:PIN domain-containing protein [Cryobacterium frigoriphilum]|uniref:PIN domain-containing protein n=1 Tax=Cryobacterium frigoriphilum TaxID=1259150 RepID=A0A4R9A179_9MICO|nr:type II toxin-antitoxin system VapC family toxin [Cryobacterium frigoriphilum]TFD50260.1 PIN domain-containing protein [Cryobacterium frigoriphilum]
MISYLDTSAVAKLLADEPETSPLREYLDEMLARGDAEIVSAYLAETELRRMATRTGIPQTAVTEVLSRLALMEMDRNLFRDAGLLPGTDLRSLDALHIAAALHVGAGEFVTYDRHQQQAAEAVGLPVRVPGRIGN